MSDDEGRFARWSRRKHDARRAGRRGGAAPVPVAPAATATSPLPGEGDAAASVPDPDAIAAPAAGPPDAVPAPATTPPALPAIDDLDADSDYTGFLADGVPEALTRAALRKLWLSDPVFANLDGLNDYDENFNLIDRVIQAADTNYRVGRGMLNEDERRAEQAQDSEPTTGDDAGAAGAGVADGEADDGDTAAAAAPADDGTDSQAAADEDDKTRA